MGTSKVVSYFLKHHLKSYSIVRMKEHSSYIIVSEEFKDICDKKKLKGFNFTEEGYSIWR